VVLPARRAAAGGASGAGRPGSSAATFVLPGRRVTLAHVGGLPVGETLAMVAPVAGLWASLVLCEVRR
jgi:hypothetical protein